MGKIRGLKTQQAVGLKGSGSPRAFSLQEINFTVCRGAVGEAKHRGWQKILHTWSPRLPFVFRHHLGASGPMARSSRSSVEVRPHEPAI